MTKYRVNRVKPSSNALRYEIVRERGMMVETGGSHPRLLKGKDLDDYLDLQRFKRKHPNLEPTKEWEVP